MVNCDLADPIINDIVMYDWYSDHYSLNFFTDRPVDLDLIKLLNTEEVNDRSRALIKGLQHNFPFVFIFPMMS